jgi:hypothetical protein
MKATSRPASPYRGRLSAFLGCREGASLVEFALVLPLVLLFLVGMFEVAWLMYIESAMEGALRESARYGITGRGGDDAAREAEILARIEEYTFGSIQIDPSNIEKRVYQSFNDVGLPEPWTDMPGYPNPGDPPNGVYDPGEPFTEMTGDSPASWDDDRGTVGVGASGEVVQYRLTYQWQPLTGVVQAFVGGINLEATTVVRNEPY